MHFEEDSVCLSISHPSLISWPVLFPWTGQSDWTPLLSWGPVSDPLSWQHSLDPGLDPESDLDLVSLHLHRDLLPSDRSPRLTSSPRDSSHQFVQRHFPPLTSPPPLPVSSLRSHPQSQILYAERRFGGSHGLSPGSGIAFYRSRGDSGGLQQTLPRIHRNPTASDSPILGSHRRLATSTYHSSSGQRKLDETASAVATDLLYRYGGSMTSDRQILDRSASGRSYQRQSNQQQTGQQSSLLCRCGSGGALPVPSSGSPPLPVVCPTHSFGQSNSSSFRGVQSLPSTPNALRRPLSPNSLVSRPATNYGLEVAPPSGRVGFSDIIPPLSLPPVNHPEERTGQMIPQRDQQHFVFEGPGPVSESAILAGDLSSTEDGILAGRFRALQQFNHHQARNLRYRSSSQPLMKLSTLVIVILALIIIGFIVLSPLFHYFM